MSKYIFLTFFLSLKIYGSAVDGISLENWKEFSHKLRQDKSLVMYFTFEKETDALVLKNKAHGKNASMFDAKLKEPIWIPGRWKGKTAISLDAVPVVVAPYNIENKQFTFEMWFRKNGCGAKRGNNNSKSGTLAGQSGYNSGWRITTKCDLENKPVRFSIGGKDVRFSVESTNIKDFIWHHLAVTWNGKVVRIYVDGELSQSKKFDGDYTPVSGEKGWEKFKIGGYTGLGLGSVKLDVGELAIFNRALSAKEIEKHRYMICSD